MVGFVDAGSIYIRGLRQLIIEKSQSVGLNEVIEDTLAGRPAIEEYVK